MEDAMRDIIEVICSARNQVMIYLNKEEWRFYDDKKVIDVIKRSLKFRNLHIAWLISRDQRPYLNQKICNLISNKYKLSDSDWQVYLEYDFIREYNFDSIT